MIAPARRAARRRARADRCRRSRHGRGGRARARDARRRTRSGAAARARQRHAADAGARSTTSWPLRVKRPLAKLDAAVLAHPAPQRLSADLPVAAAGLGGHQRCGRADAASRKVERGRPRQRGAAGAVARARAADVAAREDDRRSSCRSSIRIRAGWSSAGWRVTASRDTTAWLAFNNQPAAMCLAANRHLTTREALAEELAERRRDDAADRPRGSTDSR